MGKVSVLLLLSFLVLADTVMVRAQKSRTLDRIDFLRNSLRDPESNYILVAAHRGSHKVYPENSLPAFFEAIKIGADIVEVDIHMTRDSVLVLMHDPTIDRTTTGNGRVADFTFKQLQQFYLKDSSGNPTCYKIPSLRAILQAASQSRSVLVNIDKASQLFKEVSEVAASTNANDLVIVKSNLKVYRILEDAHWLQGSLIMPVIHLEKWPDALSRIDTLQKELNPLLFEIVFEKDNDNTFLRLQEHARYPFRFWYTSTSPDATGRHDDEVAVVSGRPDQSWGWLMRHRARVIMTNYPEALIHYLTLHKKRSL